MACLDSWANHGVKSTRKCPVGHRGGRSTGRGARQNQDEMLQTGRLSHPYKGIGDCFKRVTADEGNKQAPLER